MSVPEIIYCPGSLAEGFSTYSPAFLRRMFDNKHVSHILPYDAAQVNEIDAEKFMENRKRISISGVQEKMSFELVKKYENETLQVLVEQINEQGKAQGRSTQNKLVYFLGSESLIGKTVPVKITKAMPNVLRGELVQ